MSISEESNSLIPLQNALQKHVPELTVPRGNSIVDGIAIFLAGVIGAVPVVGSPIASLISGGYTAAKERRLNLFLDKLVCHIKDIPTDTLESEAFVQAVTSAARASASTQQDEKIRLFARMFSTYANGQVQMSSDEYEEQMRILENMSVREFSTLLVISKHQQEAKSDQDYLTALLDKIEAEVGIDLQEIPGTLERLRRTGLYQVRANSGRLYYEHRGLRLDFDYGYLTQNFGRFVEVLGLSTVSGAATPALSSSLVEIAVTKNLSYDFRKVCFSISTRLPDERAKAITSEILESIQCTGIAFGKPDPETGQHSLNGLYDHHRCTAVLAISQDLNMVWKQIRSHPDVVDIWLPELHEENKLFNSSPVHPFLKRG